MMEQTSDASETQQSADSGVPPGKAAPVYTIKRRNRYWEVLDESGDLVCLTVYKRGAEEVVRRIGALDSVAGVARAGIALEKSCA